MTLAYMNWMGVCALTASALGGKDRVSDPLKLELQVSVSCLIEILGTKLGLRAVYTLNC